MPSKKYILSNGLCVLSVKKKTKDLVLLALTDFNNTGKFLFDTAENKVISGSADLKLIPGDMDIIQTCVKSYEKTPVVKVAATLAVES